MSERIFETNTRAKCRNFHVKIVSKVQSMRCSQREVTIIFSPFATVTKQNISQSMLTFLRLRFVFRFGNLPHILTSHVRAEGKIRKEQEDARVHRFYPAIINEEYYMTVFFPLRCWPSAELFESGIKKLLMFIKNK